MTNQLKAAPPAIYGAIHKIHQAVTKYDIPKTGNTKSNKTNTNFKDYAYRTVEDIYNFISPLLAENNIICLPNVLSSEVEQMVDQYKKISYRTSVTIQYTFQHIEDGSSVTVTSIGEATDSAKSSSKASTDAAKTALTQMFIIPSKGCDPEDHYHHEYSQAPQNNREEQLQTFKHLLNLTKTDYERFLKKRNLTESDLTPERLLYYAERFNKYIQDNDIH